MMLKDLAFIAYDCLLVMIFKTQPSHYFLCNAGLVGGVSTEIDSF